MNIKSPLNYTGGKFKLLSQIQPLFPTDINTFVDLFCGGCEVGINIKSNSTIYNDINTDLINLLSTLKNLDLTDLLRQIDEIIEKYNLSDVSHFGYEYYKCNSSNGVGSYNRIFYNKLKDDFNKNNLSGYDKSVILYVLIVYAFNNQIRFNNSGWFNLPVGKRDFNKSLKKKFITFVNEIHKQHCLFTNIDFQNWDYNFLGNNDFVYADPPYLITCASYNENKGWTVNHEKRLLSFLENLSENGIRFALSNVLQNKGKYNDILIEWLNRNSYKCHHLTKNYSNSNYHSCNKDAVCDEILVTNY